MMKVVPGVPASFFCNTDRSKPDRQLLPGAMGCVKTIVRDWEN
jgi:hypothetical protein